MADDPDKMAMEMRKLRWDVSPWARAIGLAIPIAAGIIGILQYLMSERDLDLKKFQNGVAAVDFTVKQADSLLSSDPNVKTRTLTFTSELLPPDQACRVIKAVLISSPGNSDATAPISNMLGVLKDRYPTVKECSDADVYEHQNRIKQAFLAPVTSPASLGKNVGGGAGAVSGGLLPDVGPSTRDCKIPDMKPEILPLVVYYQTAQAEDRDVASRIGFEMPEQFPSAGIDLVPRAAGVAAPAEVRFYQEAHKDAAKYLACLLTAAYAQIVKPPADGKVTFNAMPLPPKFKNLPSHRIEVWFPRIQKPAPPKE